MDEINSHATTYTGTPLPHELSDHGIHHQTGHVSRRLHNEQGTHWGMNVQESCPTHIRGHHGHCLTHLRHLDGYAFEATHLQTQHWEVQQLDSN